MITFAKMIKENFLNDLDETCKTENWSVEQHNIW
jgi:hypothetical protein